MRNIMEKEEKKASFSELLHKLFQRSGARCEGYRLGLDCVVKLTEDLEFCHLKIKPNYIYSTLIIIILIGVCFSVVLFFLDSYFYGFLALFGTMGFAFYLTIYPSYLTRYHRILDA